MTTNNGKEYNLVENLKNTLANIFLWEILQTSPSYHNSLQESLQKFMIPYSTSSNNVATLVQGMNDMNLDNVSHHSELPPLEIQKKYEDFNIIVHIDRIVIKQTLIDNGSALNLCSVSLLVKINVSKHDIKPDSLSIHGFDIIGKQPLGFITLPIRVGNVTLQTLFHVMPDDISYCLLLERL